MDDLQTQVVIHRFRDYVQLFSSGRPGAAACPSVYFDAATARQAGQALIDAATDIETTKYHLSQFEGRTIDAQTTD